jgi:hypothetical protein
MHRNLLYLALLAPTACARFENPIVAEDGPRFDEALAGHWFAEGEEGKFEMVIEREGAQGRIVTTETKAGKDPESDQLRLITARLGQQNFASVAGLKQDSNWMLFRYELVPPGRLIVYQDNDGFWDDAVRNGLVPGDSAADGKVRNSTVTASSEELRAFVQGYGSVIFKDQPAVEFTRFRAD